MDRKPAPYSLVWGMVSMLFGLLALAFAHIIGGCWWRRRWSGSGSAVFHPESARVARMASGGQHGLAQSLFQVGGNAGLALGPLLGRVSSWCSGHCRGSRWCRWSGWCCSSALAAGIKRRLVNRGHAHDKHVTADHGLSPAKIRASIAVLLALMFSKFFYLSSIGSYYEFYLIGKFNISVHNAQYCLFVFLASVAAGTIIGGPIGDRVGRKLVIWCSILGVLPFTLLLPHASLLWTIVLSVPIGVILASAFPAIIVYAQELLPGRVGLVSGLFFGLAFGMGGIGAAVLGQLADRTSIGFVYQVCAFLPAIGFDDGAATQSGSAERQHEYAADGEHSLSVWCCCWVCCCLRLTLRRVVSISAATRRNRQFRFAARSFPCRQRFACRMVFDCVQLVKPAGFRSLVTFAGARY